MKKEIVFYKLNGRYDHKLDLTNENLQKIMGMKVKCIYNNDEEKIGYASVNEKFYTDGMISYFDNLELWTLKDFDKTKHLEHYDQIFSKVDTNNIIKIEAILNSNPRWGTLPSNDFEFTTNKNKEDVDDKLEVPPFLRDKTKKIQFKYIYVEYLDSIGDKMYCYTSDQDFEKDDIVIVPRGYNDEEVYARVITTKYYDYDKEPLPYIDLKEVYCKVDKDAIDIEKYKNDASIDFDIDYDENGFGTIINPDLLFRYKLSDTWSFPIWELKIYNFDKNNIFIEDFEKNNKAYITIDKKDIDQISQIINDNYEFINISNGLVHPDILDGSQEEIFVNMEGITNNITFYNLWAYKNDNKIPKQAKITLKLINEINKILKKYELKIIMDEN